MIIKKAWLRDDASLLLQIINSIDNEVVGLVNHMDYLEYLYSGKGNLCRIYEVCKAFYHSEKEAKSLTTYFMEFKKAFEELNVLLPFSADIKVQQAQREQMAIMSFLAGLTSAFELLNHKFYPVPRTPLSKMSSVGCRIQRVLYPINKSMCLLQKEEERTMIQGNGIITMMQEGGTTTIMLGDGIITKEETMMLGSGTMIILVAIVKNLVT